MAYRVGHDALGTRAAAWLRLLADPLDKTPRRARPMAPEALAPALQRAVTTGRAAEKSSQHGRHLLLPV